MALDPEFKNLTDRVKDLERRVLDAETNNTRAGNTAITEGALVIRDGSGNARAKYGRLDDGTYGLALYDDSGDPVSLASLLLGLTGARNDAEVIPTRNAWTDDLSSTVTTSSGRLLVIVTARVVAGASGSGTPSAGVYGYRVHRDGLPIVPVAFERGIYVNFNSQGMNTIGQQSAAYIETGLDPGQYTVRSAMYNSTIGSPSNDAAFSNRNLVVLPW